MQHILGGFDTFGVWGANWDGFKERRREGCGEGEGGGGGGGGDAGDDGRDEKQEEDRLKDVQEHLEHEAGGVEHCCSGIPENEGKSSKVELLIIFK